MSKPRAKSPLTWERLREVLDYDPETGIFTWRLRFGKDGRKLGWSGKVAGNICQASGYRIIGIDGITYRGGRLAWLYINGEWPPCVVDHIDCDRANDRYANLRLASISENARNTISLANALGAKGVVQTASGKFRAQIFDRGSVLHLGVYSTQEEAHAAYCGAAIALYRDFFNPG
ncbi:HNH endonuclease [Novacetimonas sp. GS1]|uniref:HNH endonuclease n=1 Tax=Novacetimonas sp. GS1 TaxID=3119990 RepID=UPI002FCD5C98